MSSLSYPHFRKQQCATDYQSHDTPEVGHAEICKELEHKYIKQTGVYQQARSVALCHMFVNNAAGCPVQCPEYRYAYITEVGIERKHCRIYIHVYRSIYPIIQVEGVSVARYGWVEPLGKPYESTERVFAVKLLDKRVVQIQYMVKCGQRSKQVHRNEIEEHKLTAVACPSE